MLNRLPASFEQDYQTIWERLERALPFEWLLAAALIASFVADPVFAKFGAAEAALYILLILTGLSSLLGAVNRGLDFSAVNIRRHLPVLAFFGMFALSALVGAANQAPLTSIIRATGPYLLLGLCIPVVLTRDRQLNGRSLMIGIVIAGLAQSAYLVGLYLWANDRFDSVIELMVHRTTLIDPRTTVPIFVGAAMMPLALAGPARGYAALALAAAASCLMALASFSTLTRSHVITLMTGYAVLIAVTAGTTLLQRSITQARAAKVLAAGIVTGLVFFAILSSMPQFRMLTHAIFVRNAIELEMPDIAVDFDLLKVVLERKLSPLTVGQILEGDLKGKQAGPIVAETLRRLAGQVGMDRAYAFLDEYASVEAGQSREKVSAAPPPAAPVAASGPPPAAPAASSEPPAAPVAASKPPAASSEPPPAAPAASSEPPAAPVAASKQPAASSGPPPAAPAASSEPPAVTAAASGPPAVPQNLDVTKQQLSTSLTKTVVDANNGGAMPLGGGRLEDEVMPALNLLRQAAWHVKIFGIGAGNKYQTASGEMRTYIHNYPVYILLFNGALGLAAFVFFFGALVWQALRRWWLDGDVIGLAVLTAIASLSVYGLLFAVHKLIAFNLMLVAVYLAMFAAKPRQDQSSGA